MRKYFELLIMFLGLCPMLMAQNIQGVVTDTKGMPISFANVVELAQADSSFVKGTVSKEDGSFMLEDIKTGNVIRVSIIGYETQYINYTGQTTVTLKLQESTNMLGEVVVKSSLPKTVLRGEGMITNIEGSVLEKTSNMEQLLSRIPNVSAKDGQIEVFGRGTPVIFINGRKMQDQMDLQRLQPSNIKKIEVINNPGARYDASVKSVIRITTKKTQGEGFSFDNKTTFSVNEEKRLSLRVVPRKLSKRRIGCQWVLVWCIYSHSRKQTGDAIFIHHRYLAAEYEHQSRIHEHQPIRTLGG